MQMSGRKLGGAAALAVAVLALEAIAVAGAFTTARAWLASDEARAVGKATRVAAHAVTERVTGGWPLAPVHAVRVTEVPGGARVLVMSANACDVSRASACAARLRARAVAISERAADLREPSRLEARVRAAQRARAHAETQVREVIERLGHGAI